MSDFNIWSDLDHGSSTYECTITKTRHGWSAHSFGIGLLELVEVSYWRPTRKGIEKKARRKLARLNGKRSTESYTFRGDS